MADAFCLSGELRSTPQSGNPSGDPTIDAVIFESAMLGQKAVLSYKLLADGALPVPFGSVTNARVIMVKVTGGKVTATLTSTDGTTQAIPVDSLFLLFCASVPVTALALTRQPGQTTDVRVFLGE